MRLLQTSVLFLIFLSLFTVCDLENHLASYESSYYSDAYGTAAPGGEQYNECTDNPFIAVAAEPACAVIVTNSGH